MKKLLFVALIFLPSIGFGKSLGEYNKILVLGDSLSAGYNMPLEKGWVNLLRQELIKKNPEIEVINASVSGDTTGQGLARLKPLLQKHEPDLVILELGGNDGLRGIAPPLIKRNLATMIDMSKQSSAEVLLLGMHILPNYGKRYTEAFHQNYLDLATEKEVKLIPFFLEGVGQNTELMQKDGIHPNETAQPQLMKNVMNSFDSNL
ncbi:MAG: arylesterase [Gammaproteobacteria bacterium]|nr:arylesterase [Gammaproteobacteria bacterium]